MNKLTFQLIDYVLAAVYQFSIIKVASICIVKTAKTIFVGFAWEFLKRYGSVEIIINFVEELLPNKLLFDIYEQC